MILSHPFEENNKRKIFKEDHPISRRIVDCKKLFIENIKTTLVVVSLRPQQSWLGMATADHLLYQLTILQSLIDSVCPTFHHSLLSKSVLKHLRNSICIDFEKGNPS